MFKGFSLIDVLDCKVCYVKDKKVVGLSYIDIVKCYDKKDK